MNDKYFSISIIELNEDEEIINRCESLNDILMSIDVTDDIHKQAVSLGYDNIYTEKDIEKEIAYNIQAFGGN